MRLNVSVFAAAFLLAGEASAKCVQECRNNCLHSLARSDLKQRVYDDCEEYLAVTVRQLASTATTTVVLATTSVATQDSTGVVTLDKTTTASTQTNYLSQTTTLEIATSYTTETVYTIKTVDAKPKPVRARRFDGLEARTPLPQDKAYPTYASTCGSSDKYSTACSCIGVRPRTTTVSQATVTETSTQYTPVAQTQVVVHNVTSINYTPVTDTVEQTTYIATQTSYATTATTTEFIYTATVISVVRNGDFETGDFEYWVESSDNEIDFSITQPGESGSKYALETGELYDNDLLEFYQDTLAEAGVRYDCTWDMKFTNYYETEYSNGNTYIPYCHIYLNRNTRYTDWNSPNENNKGTWLTSTFSFNAIGGDRLWFDCASPQPETGDGSGPNKLYLDKIACIEAGT